MACSRGVKGIVGTATYGCPRKSYLGKGDDPGGVGAPTIWVRTRAACSSKNKIRKERRLDRFGTEAAIQVEI